MIYNFYGWETADVPAVNEEYGSIRNPRMLYDLLSRLWCAETCAPRMRENWTKENKTLGQCSITAFLAQDIFGGKVYGILRSGGNYHCYNVIGSCVFDLTSEQFGSEKLDYTDNPEQFREVHFAKEEKRLRYEYLKAELSLLLGHVIVSEVLEITEDDYGCEGVPDDGELMCSVLVKDENGTKRRISLSDSYLRQHGIKESDFILT